MEHIIKGNVFKTKYESIIIITEVLDSERFLEKNRGKYYVWISFNYTNSGGGTYYKTIEEERICYDSWGDICTDSDCPICNGSGKYIGTDWGLEDAEFLGETVKDYVLKSLTKNFNF